MSLLCRTINVFFVFLPLSFDVLTFLTCVFLAARRRASNIIIQRNDSIALIGFIS